MFIGRTPYRARVKENVDVGTALAFDGDEIISLDNDIGRNAIINYSIIRDVFDLFYIEPKTGVLKTKKDIGRMF